MSSEKKPSRWKQVLGYGAFALVAFIVFFFLTFPYGTLRRRLVQEAAEQGYALRIGRLRPGLRGITATQIQLSKVLEGSMSAELREVVLGEGPLAGVPGLGEPLAIRSLALRPTLLPPGVAFHAELLGGTLQGAVGGVRTLQVELKMADLDLARDNLPSFLEVDMEGRLDGSVSLVIPPAQGRPAGPDFGQTEGQVALDGKALIIKGGKLTVPVYGQPTKVDLPTINLGALDARMRFEKGLGTAEALNVKGDDLELQGSGTIKLARQVNLSELGLDLKLRVEPEAVNRLGLLGAGLGVLPTDKDDPKFRAARLSGVLSRPNFGPAMRR